MLASYNQSDPSARAYSLRGFDWEQRFSSTRFKNVAHWGKGWLNLFEKLLFLGGLNVGLIFFHQFLSSENVTELIR